LRAASIAAVRDMGGIWAAAPGGKAVGLRRLESAMNSDCAGRRRAWATPWWLVRVCVCVLCVCA